MDEELVKKITQEVLAKLGEGQNTNGLGNKPQTSNYSSTNQIKGNNSVIILLCGGDREIKEVYRQIEIISGSFKDVNIVMTYSAVRILGLPDVRKASQGGRVITEYSQDYLENVLQKADAIFVPILSLSTASKVAALNADSLGTITMVFGLMYGIPVVAARNSIFCCGIEPGKINPLMLQQVNKMIGKLEEMGIKVVDVSQLSNFTSIRKSNTKTTTMTPSQSYTIGTAGKGEHNMTVKALVNGGAARVGSETGVVDFDKEIAKYIDHTNLKADATEEEITKLCEEAAKYGFASVCVNPTNVAKAAEILKGTPVKVCTVIGFPLGATTPTVKAIETRDAIANGAQEVDMVINVGALKSGNDDLVKKDIEAVVNAAKGKAIVKVILETALLTKEQIVKGSLLAKLAGADFVKTSTS